MAILPTLLVAGEVAQGIGSVAQGFGAARDAKLSPAQAKLLEELRKRRAAGNLGLSDKERRTMAGKLEVPIASTEREANARFNAAATMGDAGAGAGAKAFQGETTRRAERRLGVTQAVNEADVQKEATNRDMLLQLDAQNQAAKNAKRAAWVNLATAGLATAGAVGKAIGPSVIQKREQNAVANDEYAQRKAVMEAAYGRKFTDEDARAQMALEDQYHADQW
jgi:hypothetical protein